MIVPKVPGQSGAGADVQGVAAAPLVCWRDCNGSFEAAFSQGGTSRRSERGPPLAASAAPIGYAGRRNRGGSWRFAECQTFIVCLCV